MAKLEDVILRGTTAGKPAATAVAVGTLYYDTDLTTLERSNGATWQTYASGSADAILDTIVDAKGDLIAATAADTVARLAVGTNGQFLKANSATATGLEWGAGGGGATALDDLTDVTITTPATGAVLKYNGSAWIDDAESGIQPTLADAKGDIIAATAADTFTRLAVGTNGQVLTADSAEATGIKWAAASGAGIPATIVDAKGDLIAATAADTVARLAVGSNGQVLTADSAEATGLKWAAAGGGSTTTTVRVPINLATPRSTSLAGTSFWTVTGLTAWDAGHWEFVKDVEGRVYGTVAIPHNVAGTPVAKIVLALGANATSGATRFTVGTKAVADGESLNPASFTAETAIDTTVPGTARLRKDVTFPASGAIGETVAADDILIVEITHNGDHTNDTLAVNTELYGAWLQIDVTG
jgi:hypothetical protein